MAKKSSKRFYLVHVYGSVDPSIMGKPYPTYDKVLNAARKFVASKNYTEGEDGIFYLVTQKNRNPVMGSFTSDEFENTELDDDLFCTRCMLFCTRCMVEHLDEKCPHSKEKK